jgi:uncharacterized membrane protein YesL
LPHRPTTEQTDGGNRSPSRLRTADILGPAFRRFLWNCYDHLGLLIVANLLWLVLLVPIVTAPAATAGLFEIARRIANREEVSVRDFFLGFRRDLLPASRVGGLTLLSGFLLWVAIDFYSHLGGWASLPGMFLAAALVWIATFFLLMHIHLHPLIATGDRGLKTLLRKAGLLVLDNVGYTVGIAVQALMVAVICTLTGAGLVLILGSCLAVLLSTGHRELLKRYFPDSPEAQEAEETRRWRDVLRPWDAPKPH